MDISEPLGLKEYIGAIKSKRSLPNNKKLFTLILLTVVATKMEITCNLRGNNDKYKI